MIGLNVATDIMRDGFLNTMLRPYIESVGESVFWMMVSFVVVGLAYLESNDVFYPVVFIMIAGSVLGSVLSKSVITAAVTVIGVCVGAVLIRVIQRLGK